MGIYRRYRIISHTVIVKLILLVFIVTAVYLLGALPFFLSFCFAVTVHELGHFIAAKLLGVRILSFKVSLLGLRIRYSVISAGMAAECAVCLSGSMLGMIAAATVSYTPLIESDSAVLFVTMSVTLSVFNLLPLRGLDGGALLMGILDRSMLPHKAEAVMDTVSFTLSIILWIISVRIQLRVGVNLSLLTLSVYLLHSNIRK